MTGDLDKEMDAVAPENGELPDTESHDIPMPQHLREAIAADWDPAPPMPHPARPDGASYTPKRRASLSSKFPGQLIVVPAGTHRVRANDTDFPFRASSSFTWLTGETVADAVLALEPVGNGHEATLFIREYAQPGTVEYFTSRTHGAVWVGNVPSVDETADALDRSVISTPCSTATAGARPSCSAATTPTSTGSCRTRGTSSCARCSTSCG
jgi:Xaa-Pro aminopeptidase